MLVANNAGLEAGVQEQPGGKRRCEYDFRKSHSSIATSINFSEWLAVKILVADLGRAHRVPDTFAAWNRM